MGTVALGYLPTLLLRTPVASMAVAPLLMLPVGVKASSVSRAGVTGVVFGLILAVSIASASHAVVMQRMLALSQMLRAVAGATAVMCGTAAALFAHYARKRRQRIEDEWR